MPFTRVPLIQPLVQPLVYMESIGQVILSILKKEREDRKATLQKVRAQLSFNQRVVVYDITPSLVTTYNLLDVVDEHPNNITQWNPVASLEVLQVIPQKSLLDNTTNVTYQGLLNTMHSCTSEASRQIIVHMQLISFLCWNKLSNIMVKPQYRIGIVLLSTNRPIAYVEVKANIGHCFLFFIFIFFVPRIHDNGPVRVNVRVIKKSVLSKLY